MKLDNFCLIISTVTKCQDLWPMFFGQLDKFLPDIKKKYVLVDKTDYDFGDDYEVIFYDGKKKYREQLLECFPHIKEEYCLYLQEDYVLYEKPKWDHIENLLSYLKSNQKIDFVKLIRSSLDSIELISESTDVGLALYDIVESNTYYTQQPTIWKFNKLVKIFEDTPSSHIGGIINESSGGVKELHFEQLANKSCKENCTGLLYYNNEPKRGLYHHDSSIFPFIASALVRGKWNLSEYSNELIPLVLEYNIDLSLRGGL